MPRRSSDSFDEDEIDEAEADESDASEDADTLPCPHCGADVYDDSDLCPRCGNFIHHESGVKPRWMLLTAILLIVVLSGLLGFFAWLKR